MSNSPPNSSAEDRRSSSLRGKKKKKASDYGQLTVDALNRHMSTPEFSARYKAWLEHIGPAQWTPIARQDYETMTKENIDPDLVAKYRAELESNRR
ncbi:hypothetical protein RSO01_93200 [Reyranella soli]|uniref:Uncharacterized protein n=1 Tax=Reyranella soli TaxID=1230389 RepID=A0A512NT83_9HYPH|nr:hypothetical protein RSO01_93200 [Reyranella soli]